MKKTEQTQELSAERLAELKHNANEILAYCRQAVLTKHPFAGTVSMNLDLIPIRDSRCATAMTDGQSIFFDIDFLSRLNQEEREFVLGHEIWHVIMLHFLRGEGKDHSLFNIATDMEVNQLLESDGFIAPTQVVFPNPRHARKSMFNFPDGLSAEEYYELIMQQAGTQQKDGEGQNNGKGLGGKKKSSSQKDLSGSGNGQFDKHYDKNKNYENEEDEEVFDKYGKKGHDEDFKPASMRVEAAEREAAERIREAIVGAAQQIERTRGTLPGFIKKIVDSLLTPKMPWRELLASFITTSLANKTDWNHPNRRFAWSGTYLPSHNGEMVKLAIGIDTSGSCANDCQAFLSEVVGIAKTFGNYELHLIQCDTEVQSYDMFDENNPLDPQNPEIEFKGFGGTTLKPIFDYVDLNELDVDALIVFTDGECENFNDEYLTELPVLWVLTSDQKEDRKNLQIGTQIHLEK